MNDIILINVAWLIGSPLCISIEDGQKVFDKVESLLKTDKKVIISFNDVTFLIPVFLNVAIGQLYSRFSEDTIRSMVSVEGLSVDDMNNLKLVVDTAKKYFNKVVIENELKWV